MVIPRLEDSVPLVTLKGKKTPQRGEKEKRGVGGGSARRGTRGRVSKTTDIQERTGWVNRINIGTNLSSGFCPPGKDGMAPLFEDFLVFPSFLALGKQE
jgi:hypothetical protein